mmetsp:Transcript_11030/g.68048  ORF Transcript_11030/g.68048 Transcript_11030/m.68048 type:complete len:283 (+) Transcript_11030:804-1652(+)
MHGRGTDGLPVPDLVQGAHQLRLHGRIVHGVPAGHDAQLRLRPTFVQVVRGAHGTHKIVQPMNHDGGYVSKPIDVIQQIVRIQKCMIDAVVGREHGLRHRRRHVRVGFPFDSRLGSLRVLLLWLWLGRLRGAWALFLLATFLLGGLEFPFFAIPNLRQVPRCNKQGHLPGLPGLRGSVPHLAVLREQAFVVASQRILSLLHLQVLQESAPSFGSQHAGPSTERPIYFHGSHEADAAQHHGFGAFWIRARECQGQGDPPGSAEEHPGLDVEVILESLHVLDQV